MICLRSAALRKLSQYEDCLRDIARAAKFGYPRYAAKSYTEKILISDNLIQTTPEKPKIVDQSCNAKRYMIGKMKKGSDKEYIANLSIENICIYVLSGKTFTSSGRGRENAMKG